MASKKKDELKPGYQTTEFVMAAAAMAGIVFGVPVPPEVAGWMITGIASVYVVIRGWLKSK